ncbi:MAG: hypothetical protein RMY62_008110 [Nostoc sp. ZfuVER08]|uniref:Uncharacterized protein n=1 Tax=Nostoc punctiforme FACHB-252 TaxID=1357509 RepID=A0ABR8HD34_NOSPU|nr:hypothetical protein [Nostoc punctiforme]MBD2613216.1 hypothetical protein [Nostoc punctiforme FACHB-252]MDZ8014933.1 hypothetical protein [Nostoc sp. ZfuVER08]
MPQSQKLSPLDDLHQRIDTVAKCKERLEQEILQGATIAPKPSQIKV